MKLLADMGVSRATASTLRRHGHDVVHLREEGLQRLPDHRIMAKAADEGRVVVTFDLDFADLHAASGSRTPSVVVLRLSDATPAAVDARVLPVLDAAGDALRAGAVIAVEDTRYRVRTLPIATTTS